MVFDMINTVEIGFAQNQFFICSARTVYF